MIPNPYVWWERFWEWSGLGIVTDQIRSALDPDFWQIGDWDIAEDEEQDAV